MLAASDTASPCDADDGVDVTLIRWMLSLSPQERLAVLQGFVDSVEAGRDKDRPVLPSLRCTLQESNK